MKFRFSSTQERDPDKGRFSIQREFFKKCIVLTEWTLFILYKYIAIS